MSKYREWSNEYFLISMKDFPSIFHVYIHVWEIFHTDTKCGKDLRLTRGWEIKYRRFAHLIDAHSQLWLSSGLFYASKIADGRRCYDPSNANARRNHRGCACPFPGNFRDRAWSIMKLSLPLSLPLSLSLSGYLPRGILISPIVQFTFENKDRNVVREVKTWIFNFCLIYLDTSNFRNIYIVDE